MVWPRGHARHLACPLRGCQLRRVLQAPQRLAPDVACAVPAMNERRL